ncbi:MAG TPA: tRNA (adenosine(37)-N6)-dimethylallyltransferase MiaA, partial [Thermoanaerobaculia bacterium]|nr:tRNA (adenosine(37)-N6)-dimethylallyltransferase MiaA [Thermoanaerobaculia bacterium]
AAVIAGAKELSSAIEETKRRTRAYAKRQMTWLRAEQDVHWLDAPRALDVLAEEALAIVRHGSPRENE